jgi:uncharacterized DUF497 family protein
LTFPKYRIYNNYAEIEFDPAKRAWTLRERGLDFAKAEEIFARFSLTFDDGREDYREERFLTYGILDGGIVVCVWTAREDRRRIISLRKAEKDEREIYNLYRP